jgi:hypothetical protein
MSQKRLVKIDKFFYLFAVVMVALAAFVVVVFKEIFSSIRTSSEVTVSLSENDLKVDKNKLQEAVDLIDASHTVELIEEEQLDEE